MVIRAIATYAVVTLLGMSVAVGNEYAYGYRYANYIDGVRGNMGIRTDPGTVLEVGYVHAVWVYNDVLDVEFVSLGTANGNGASGPQGTCADDYDPLWSIYADWYLNGSYGCITTNQDVYGVGANPSFEVSWTTCAGFPRWVLTMGAVPRACLLPNWTSGTFTAIGIETVKYQITTDYNIDAKYTNLRKNYTSSGTWWEFGSCELTYYVDPNYEVDVVSNTACNTFLPPLN